MNLDQGFAVRSFLLGHGISDGAVNALMGAVGLNNRIIGDLDAVAAIRSQPCLGPLPYIFTAVAFADDECRGVWSVESCACGKNEGACDGGELVYVIQNQTPFDFDLFYCVFCFLSGLSAARSMSCAVSIIS